jgi:flavodoxin
MKPCVVYFSRTGNTKRVAEDVSKATKTPSFDMTPCEPSVVENFELLVIGTPVEGFNPAKEAKAFVEKLPRTEDKKAILFCTYALWRGKTFGVLKKVLANKGIKQFLKFRKKERNQTNLQTFPKA